MTAEPCDGVEFHPLDFSRPPDEQRPPLDVILHKLSEDIMFRCVKTTKKRRGEGGEPRPNTRKM